MGEGGLPVSDIAEERSYRPDPITTLDGAFFWNAADEKRFVAQQCCGCERLWHPPRAMCPSCHSTEKAEAALSGRGKVISWIVPVHPPAFGFATPPIVALVEVEEGLRFVTNVEGVDPAAMKTGLHVQVAFAKTNGGRFVPIFRPVEGDK